MKKTLLSSLLSLVLTFSSSSEEAIFQKGRVKRIIDGDTIELMDKRKLRFANTNAPEKDSDLYRKSLDYVKSLLGRNISFEELGRNDDRIIARIYFSTNYVNLKSVEQGYASKFMVQGNELNIFEEAEREAIEKERGIWKKSRYFGDIRVNIDSIKESVTLEYIQENKENKQNSVLSRLNSPRPKSKSSVSLEGWVMKDESRETFTFPRVELGKIIILSGSAAESYQNSRKSKSSRQTSSEDLVWTTKNIWNNDRDTLYLFDREGRIAAYFCYGYYSK